jgi:putative thioredoxin
VQPEIIAILKRGAGFAFPQGAAPSRGEEDRAEDMRAVAYAGLVKAALGEGQVEAAKEVAEALRARCSKARLELPEVKSALAAAALARPAADTPEAESEHLALDKALQADPGNSEARLGLAKLCFAKGLHAEAVDEALELLKRDKAYGSGAARTLLLDIFSALGPASPLVKEGRRKMASLLLN